MVQGKAVEHLAHVEAYLACRASDRFAYLSEHCVVVDVDLDEGRVFAIDECQITVRAEVGTAIGERDQLVIRFAADVVTEASIRVLYE